MYTYTPSLIYTHECTMCGIRNMVYSTFRVPPTLPPDVTVYSTYKVPPTLPPDVSVYSTYRVPPTLPPDVTVYCNIKFPFSVMVNMSIWIFPQFVRLPLLLLNSQDVFV